MRKPKIHKQVYFAIVGFGVLMSCLGCSYIRPHYFSEAPVKITSLEFNEKNDKITGLIVNRSSQPIRRIAIWVHIENPYMDQLIEMFDLKPKESRHIKDKLGLHIDVPTKLKIYSISTADYRGNIVRYKPDTN